MNFKKLTYILNSGLIYKLYYFGFLTKQRVYKDSVLVKSSTLGIKDISTWVFYLKFLKFLKFYYDRKMQREDFEISD